MCIDQFTVRSPRQTGPLPPRNSVPLSTSEDIRTFPDHRVQPAPNEGKHARMFAKRNQNCHLGTFWAGFPSAGNPYQDEEGGPTLEPTLGLTTPSRRTRRSFRVVRERARGTLAGSRSRGRVARNSELQITVISAAEEPMPDARSTMLRCAGT